MFGRIDHDLAETGAVRLIETGAVRLIDGALRFLAVAHQEAQLTGVTI